MYTVNQALDEFRTTRRPEALRRALEIIRDSGPAWMQAEEVTAVVFAVYGTKAKIPDEYLDLFVGLVAESGTASSLADYLDEPVALRVADRMFTTEPDDAQDACAKAVGLAALARRLGYSIAPAAFIAAAEAAAMMLGNKETAKFAEFIEDFYCAISAL
ncbi:hypothetical protein [Thermogutta sp.]|uniref:hypothetical protein n=1 Tax=Thermogutta sp. TaxID=1962930 RepID=UPI0032201029